MRILHIHEKTAIHGGAEVYIKQLQDLLPEYSVDTEWMGIEEIDAGFIISRFGSEKKEQFPDTQSLFNYLEAYLSVSDTDIVNIHNLFQPDIVRFFLEHIPVIKSVHSPVMVCPGRDKFWRFSEQPCTIPYGLHCFYHIYSQGCANRHPKRVKSQWNYVRFESKEAAFLYKKIVVMSDYMKSGLLECKVPEDKIIVNPYFTPLTDPPAENKNQKKRLLFVGRLVSSKGPHIMIEAMEKLLKEREELVLDIVGDGLMRRDFENLANKLGLGEKVIFHGWKSQEEIDQFIRNAYLILFPSVYPEAFGIVGIEAMMRKKAVVAFDVGGVGTWLKNGVNGFLVPNKNQKELADKVSFLVERPDIIKEMGRNGRDMALKEFTPDIHIKRLIGVYKSVLN